MRIDAHIIMTEIFLTLNNQVATNATSDAKKL